MSATYLSELSVGLDWECWPLLRSVYISREIMNNLIKVEEIDFSYSFCLQVAFLSFQLSIHIIINVVCCVGRVEIQIEI